MKLLLSLLLTTIFAFSIVGCAQNQYDTAQPEQPYNIDKNNVGITSAEKPDQTDPTLIEGNLENNDFKN